MAALKVVVVRLHNELDEMKSLYLSMLFGYFIFPTMQAVIVLLGVRFLRQIRLEMLLGLMMQMSSLKHILIWKRWAYVMLLCMMTDLILR